MTRVMSVMCDSIAVPALSRQCAIYAGAPLPSMPPRCLPPAGRMPQGIPYNPSMRWLRLVKILRVALKYGLDEFLLGHERFRWLRPTVLALTFWRDLSAPRAQRLRLALQELGPI